MEYKTRTPNQPPATADDLRGMAHHTEALQAVLSLFTRDLVAARRAATVAPSLTDEVKAHETAIELITVKLVTTNLAYFEARDSAVHAPPPTHPHSHGHSH